MAFEVGLDMVLILLAVIAVVIAMMLFFLSFGINSQGSWLSPIGSVVRWITTPP